jgi:hypothetical protein
MTTPCTASIFRKFLARGVGVDLIRDRRKCAPRLLTHRRDLRGGDIAAMIVRHAPLCEHVESKRIGRVVGAKPHLGRDALEFVQRPFRKDELAHCRAGSGLPLLRPFGHDLGKADPDLVRGAVARGHRLRRRQSLRLPCDALRQGQHRRSGAFAARTGAGTGLFGLGHVILRERTGQRAHVEHAVGGICGARCDSNQECREEYSHLAVSIPTSSAD